MKVELGDFKGADSILRQVEESDRMNAMQGVARAVVAKGHKKKALAWATSQISSRDRALALVGIADALLTSTQAADSWHYVLVNANRPCEVLLHISGKACGS